ncbi:MULTISPECIES: hypothetical protein [Pseudofrankia]|uniref:hypothetical protein n=1 Tax=Pseudofrankia TaxID=2994363 RepID=UPI000234CA55|nr:MULTISPECIES: hypothetical protein [Pseudofrankia]OHV41522.1 hypothetical protein BCD49_00765 [Pseudofrankia sp. EUN1h]
MPARFPDPDRYDIHRTDRPGLRELYTAECRAHGREPGIAQFPDRAAPTAVFVADDVDSAWDELGAYLLHDATTAAAYRILTPRQATDARAHLRPPSENLRPT